MPDLFTHAAQILRLLKQHKNVLVVGPPATGKSRVMSEVKTAFVGTPPPAYDGKGHAPFPKTTTQRVEPWMPSPTKSKRQVFEVTFHQGTKHRQFISGIIPKLSGAGGFEATEGIMLRSNRHAQDSDGTSLLCIDEINRGPAVSIFGDALTAIEADKRLDESNNILPTSVPFYAHDPSGAYGPDYLSPHQYLVASMNEADSSVEPLDVAFLRRFYTYRLTPEPKTAAAFLGISENPALPDAPSSHEHIYGALWKAWMAVNSRIALGRSPTFELGHGVLMWAPPPTALADSISYAEQSWRRIEAHVDEVFFGNEQARAITYNAGTTTHYRLNEAYFGDQPVMQLRKEPGTDLYKLLLEVGRNTQGD